VVKGIVAASSSLNTFSSNFQLVAASARKYSWDPPHSAVATVKNGFADHKRLTRSNAPCKRYNFIANLEIGLLGPNLNDLADNVKSFNCVDRSKGLRMSTLLSSQHYHSEGSVSHSPS
jgi:hypothetical protein